MTQTVQSITSYISPTASLSGITRVDGGTTTENQGILGQSVDRSWFFRGNGTALQASNDGGATWSNIRTFATEVRAFVELKNGEVLVGITSGGATNSTIFKSSGWGSSLAAKQAATFTQKFQTNAELRGYWSLNPQCLGPNGIVLINEYGAQTTTGGVANAANDTRARRVWMSKDNAETASVIFDIMLNGDIPDTSATGCHIHAAVYDNIDNRVIITYGDSTGAGPQISGTANCQIRYADVDPVAGTLGAWQKIPMLFDYNGGTLYGGSNVGDSMQYTTIFASTKNLIFGSDLYPFAPVMLPRTGYRQYGTPFVGATVNPNATQSGVGDWITQAAAGLPIFYCTRNSSSSQPMPRVLASYDEGNSWTEVYRGNDFKSSNGRSLMSLFGPDNSNRVCGWGYYDNGGTWTNGSILTATLVAPA